jgi:GR25 family glycosyltransferase involved in LPS biosynthesis
MRPRVGGRDDAMDGLDAIYWINLERATQRRAEMLRVLANPVLAAVPSMRIVAVDGNDPEAVASRIGRFERQNDVTSYEYACLLSHLDAIYAAGHAAEQDIDQVALILEDDITLELEPYWSKTIRELVAGAPGDWEIMMLWYNVSGRGFNPAEYQLQQREYSTTAYLIKTSAARRKLVQPQPGKYDLESSYPHVADYYLYRLFKTYVYKYPYFVYKTDNDSFIHPGHVATLHRRLKRNAERAFKNMRRE